MGKKLKLTQVRSVIGRRKNQKLTMQALGIRKRGRSVVHEDSPEVRGMVNTVKHLLEVEEVDG